MLFFDELRHGNPGYVGQYQVFKSPSGYNFRNKLLGSVELVIRAQCRVLNSVSIRLDDFGESIGKNVMSLRALLCDNRLRSRLKATPVSSCPGLD
jgi:hypothetical protein